MSGRFDYVKYDSRAIEMQAQAKKMCQELESFIYALSRFGTEVPRPTEYALEKLEEVYMWIGKAIRDEQVTNRNAELQEERNDE